MASVPDFTKISHNHIVSFELADVHARYNINITFLHKAVF